MYDDQEEENYGYLFPPIVIKLFVMCLLYLVFMLCALSTLMFIKLGLS